LSLHPCQKLRCLLPLGPKSKCAGGCTASDEHWLSLHPCQKLHCLLPLGSFQNVFMAALGVMVIGSNTMILQLRQKLHCMLPLGPFLQQQHHTQQRTI